MHFLHRTFSRHHRRHLQLRTLYDAAISIQRPRDRGLDHAVAREAHLQPLLNIKNHIFSNPKNTLPYSQILESRQSLQIPFRPLDLIRSYPSVFQEIYPGSVVSQPDIKLTDEVVNLSLEEDLLYQSVAFKQDVAVRLLKLLMICRVNKIPVKLLDVLKWDLGLPKDYENGLVHEFPEYFRVVKSGSGEKELELVFWSDEFAVSEMEKRGGEEGGVRFSLNYSSGFEMDKGYKKWLDEWAELDYVSPYENAMRLAVRSDESDRWAVGVLHEVLNLFVGRKAERESLMCLGDYLGIRSRFKLAFLHHPGIFYTSTKIGTQTVVLRDAYKRGAMVKRHALMDLRFKYVHLMNTMVEEEKPKNVQEKSGVDDGEEKGGVEEYGDSESEEEEDVEMCESTDEDDSEEEEESGNESQRGRRKRDPDNSEENNSRRGVERRPSGRNTRKNDYGSSERVYGRENARSDGYVPRKGREDNFEEKDSRRSMERRPNGMNTRKNEYESSRQSSRRSSDHSDRSDGYVPSKGRGDNFEDKGSRSMERRPNGMNTRKNEYESPRQSSRRSSDHSDGFVPRRPRQRTDGYEEGESKGGPKRREFKKEVNFDENNVKSKPRRSYGRDTLSNENEGSTKFSRRMNVRDYVKKQGKV